MKNYLLFVERSFYTSKNIVVTPPSILYHGTARQLVEKFFIDGLQPMAGQYVHLSVDTNTANVVEKRQPLYC
ncbi:RNA 2'-phosphotransferase [Paenibacillus sp. IITD108]|uniref:RNA 2'-phosphotransferase n=1 Tax=Paenibacillus sp. IITD108 TaxID=3116649 RepID=UPI003FA70C02